MTQAEYVSRRDELCRQSAAVSQELQILKYNYIKKNSEEIPQGQKVRYNVIKHTEDGREEVARFGEFTGDCGVSSNGSILYEISQKTVVSPETILLERNLFEVVT